MLKYHYCLAENCHVMLYNPKERYCQHHEGQHIFDAAYGTNTHPKDKDGTDNFFNKLKNLFRR